MSKEKCVCGRLRHAGRALTAYYNSVLAPSGITAGQHSILVHLKRLETASTSVLAKSMGLDRSTLARSLKPLVSAGIICDTAPPGARDRRYTLTQPGEDTFVYADRLWKKAQQELKDLLGEKKLKSFLKCLSKIETLSGGNYDEI